MGVRIRNEFYSIHNERYRVDVLDSDYAGSIITTLNAEGLKLIVGSEGDALCEPIKAGSMQYTLIDDGSGDFIAFESDLSQAQENEFKLIVYKHDGSDFVIHWAGVIMTDMVEYENKSVPRKFEIIAKDGLNRAANIEFTKINSSPYISSGVSTPQSFMKIIYDCLSYTETAQFWNGSSKPYIRVATAWYDTSQVLDNSAPTKFRERLLECIRIDRDFLFDHDFDDKGQGWTKDEHWKWLNQYGNQHTRLRSATDPALKARTILRELLQLLNLRIMLYDGSWYIIQMERYTHSTIDVVNYNYLGAYSTRTTNFDFEDTPTTVLDGGLFGYYPCLKTVSATVLPNDILSLYSGLNDTTLTKSAPSVNTTFDLGTLYGGGGSGLKLKLSFICVGYNEFLTKNPFNSSTGLPYVDAEFTFKFIGTDDASTDWAIKMTNIWNTPYKGAEWTNVTTDEAVFTLKSNLGGLNFVYSDEYAELTVGFHTPEMPFDVIRGASLEVDIRLFEVATGNTLTGSSGGDPKLWIKNPEIQVVGPDFSARQITEYIAVNPNLTIGNSFDLDLGKLRIQDTGIISGKNSLEVDEYVGAGRWTKSGIWEAGHDNDRSLVYSLLRETVAFQAKPAKKYTGEFLAPDYRPTHLLDYDSANWVFHSGSFDFKTDIWNGVWWLITRDSTGVLEPTELKNRGLGEKGQVTPIGRWIPPDLTNANFPVKSATVNGGIPVSGGAVTSIGVFALAKLGLRPEDVLYICDPLTGTVIDTVIVDDVTSENDTSITVQSFTPTEDIFDYYEICTKSLELQISEEQRATTRQSLGEGYSYSFSEILKANTTNSTTTELTTNGLTGSGTTNRIKVDTDSSYACKFTFSFKVAGSPNLGFYERKCLFYNDGGTTALQGTVQTVGTDIVAVTIAAATVTITANNTNDAIKVEVNGIEATDIEWTCRVDITVSKNA